MRRVAVYIIGYLIDQPISDVIKEDPFYSAITGWLLPERRIVRAEWKIQGCGTCCKKE